MKLLTLSFFVFFSILAFGQEIPYSFSYSSADFTDLDNPLELSGDEIWADDFYRLIDLGFEFEVAGTLFDRIEVRSGGVDFYEVGSSRSRRRVRRATARSRRHGISPAPRDKRRERRRTPGAWMRSWVAPDAAASV